ncbi:MAG TPA: NUDIX domain-containing protein [Candidatus Saccharimonadales bacterium]|nr:NUDIX domain-containing protein [Candidatus Saccharimonadales bacterium]
MTNFETFSNPDPSELHLSHLSHELAGPAYPGYPDHSARLVVNPEYLQRDYSGRVIVPNGPWSVDRHPKRHDIERIPNMETQRVLLSQGFELDSAGRPLHPWFNAMIGDPALGVVTGKGAMYNWGPNQAVDAIVVRRDQILLIQRSDNGKWAFPAGFLDAGETAVEAAKRELFEETHLDLPASAIGEITYAGPVADWRLTAHAWPATTVLLYHLPDDFPVDGLKAGDDAIDLKWSSFEEALHTDLNGSSNLFLQQALGSAATTW